LKIVVWVVKLTATAALPMLLTKNQKNTGILYWYFSLYCYFLLTLVLIILRVFTEVVRIVLMFLTNLFLPIQYEARVRRREQRPMVAQQRARRVDRPLGQVRHAGTGTSLPTEQFALEY
jgi:hypothetical protein